MPPEQWQQNNFKTGMDSPNTKISNGNWFLIVVCKFIAERIITCQCTNENPGNSLTKRESRLQNEIFIYKERLLGYKRDSRSTFHQYSLYYSTLRVKFQLLSLYFETFSFQTGARWRVWNLRLQLTSFSRRTGCQS